MTEFYGQWRDPAEVRVHDDPRDPTHTAPLRPEADAGYWELGTEDYPAPAEYFRLPGRPASAGDSARPVASPENTLPIDSCSAGGNCSSG